MEEREGVLTLTTYGETQLGPYTNKEVGQSVQLEVGQEQQALVDVLRESAAKATRAVLAMPLSSSFVTVMSFPNVSAEDDLGPRIRVEARKYIPTQISEVTLDWAEIASGAAAVGSRDVLVAAIQNTALSRLKALTDFVGFPEPPSEIECFSTIRALSDSSAEHMAIIDVGAVTTKLYITRSGLLQRMHRVRAGGAVSTKRIAEALECTFDEAEYKKRMTATTDAGFADLDRANRSTYERALGEFSEVIANYEQVLGATVSKVILAGGGTLFPTFPALAAETLKKPVSLAAPFAKVAYPTFMEDLLKTIGPSFAPAAGAALRAFE